MKALWKVGMGISLSVFISSFTFAGVNQWTTNGPAGRSANALVIDPKNPATLYVGTEDGIFKSTDSAETWLKLSLPFAVEVNALTIDPSNPATLYASYRRTIPLPDGYRTEPGVFKSGDGGVSWTEVFTPLGGDGCDTVLAIVPTTPASVYLRCNNSQLFKSVDDGRIWVLLGLPQNGSIRGIVVDPTTPTTIYTVTSSGTFRSVDSGGTWIDFEGPRFDTPTEILGFVIAPSMPHTMYANVYATTDGYLFEPVGTYQSADGGKNWTAHPRFAPDVVFDPVHPDTLYSWLTQTIDGGRNWVAINEGFPGGVGIQALTIDPRSGSSLYAAINTGTDTPAKGLVYKRQIVGTPTVSLRAMVESPQDGQPVSGIGFLRGWVFSTLSDDSYPSVFVVRDNRFDTGRQHFCCTLRDDVQAAFPQFPPEQTLNSGWGTMMNWGALSAGPHSLQAVFGDSKSSHYPDPQIVTVIKPGDFEYLERFSFPGAQASVVGDELVLCHTSNLG